MKGSTGRLSAQMIAEIERGKHDRAEELRRERAFAAQRACFIWSRSAPIPNQEEHAYLAAKGIQPHGARLSRSGALVIRILDSQKQIVNLQFILADGTKRFLTDGRKYGCFSPIGNPTPKILIAEGFATAASIHEHTGLCTIAAMDSGNLPPVAKVIRAMFPANEIIIAGDNDVSGVGQTKANEAALAIGGLVWIPKTPGYDFNDVVNLGERRHG